MAILEKNKFMLLKDKLCQERRLECFMIFTMMCFVYLQYADNFKINPYKEHFYENHIFQGTVVKGPNQNKPYQVIAVCGDELSATGGRVYLTKKVGRTSDIKEEIITFIFNLFPKIFADCLARRTGLE